MMVMKFGGTSIQDAPAIRRVAQIVRAHVSKNPVVVISAMGKTTKNLLEAATLSISGNHPAAVRKMDDIRSYHNSVANGVVSDWVNTDGGKKIAHYFAEMRKLLDGLSILGEMSLRSRDKMLSYGELISTSIVHEAFLSNGLPSVWLDARNLIITDEHFAGASPLMADTEEAVRRQILPVVEQNRIPVFQGYIGSSRNGATTTLGFEGSDYSAALVGSILDVSEIQIWKDVPGVMTADPELVPEAKMVKSITYAEAAELTFFGAKVLHPKSIEPARCKNIPVRVRNSNTPEQTGSLISNTATAEKQAIKSIAYKKPLCLLKIRSKRLLPIHEFYQSVVAAFTRETLVPFVLGAAENAVAVVVPDGDAFEPVQRHLEDFTEMEMLRNRAAVSLIGEGLQSQKDLFSEVLSNVKGESIDMVSYGVLGNSFTVVLDETSVKRVLNSLHARFFRE